MNVEKRAKIIIDWINKYCEKTSLNPKSLIVGISGGIDSSVVSTLCALTGKKTIVLSLPIKQIKSQHDLSLEHGQWLTSKFKNVEHIHFYGYYIGNFPTLKKKQIIKICNILNSVKDL